MKNLLFSSVGNNSQFYKYWCDTERKYDIFIHYYGNYSNNSDIKWKNSVDNIYIGKGWKFNVLADLHRNNMIDLNQYNYIAVFDNDLLINTENINRLFDQADKHNLYFASPSFDSNKSKISHRIMVSQPNLYMRYVNFIEVTAPVIRSDILIDILNDYNHIYTKKLIGYGFDYFMINNYYHIPNKIAIFDNISCVNPFESEKKITEREISTYCNDELRQWKFKKMVRSGLITPQKHHVYKYVYINNNNLFWIFAISIIALISYCIARGFLSLLYHDTHLLHYLDSWVAIHNPLF